MFSLFTRPPPHPFCCTVVCTRAKFCAQKNAAVPAAAKKGGASLFKKRCPSLKPSQRKFHVGSLWLEWPLCLRNENACQVMVLNDLVCFYLRCRSAHLVEVQPNFRLPPVSTMRRAQQAAFGKQSAAEQTSLAPHDSKARLRVVTTCRRFMAKPCTPHPITRKGYATSVRQQSCQRLCNAQRV